MTRQTAPTLRAVAAALIAAAMASQGAAPAGAEALDVGRAVLSVNRVEQVSPGGVEPLPEGASVLFESLIRTGADSANKDVLKDDSVLVLGPKAEVRIDSFIYDPGTNTGDAEVELVSGAMRWVSGSMAPTGYEIRTPTAVLGIRGTCLVAAVTAAGASVIVVEYGGVTVTGTSGRSVTLGPDQFTVVDPRGVPSEPGEATLPPAGPIVGRLNAALATLGTPPGTLCPTVFADLSKRAASVRTEARTIPAATGRGTFGGDGTATHLDLTHIGLTRGGGGNDDRDGQDNGNAPGNDND